LNKCVHYVILKLRFLPISYHTVPLYLNTNKSALDAVVVSVGAVSAVNSNTEFQVKVLEPVAS